MSDKQIVTIKLIRQSLYDAYLDTEYREALANSIMHLGYISDSPLTLYYGNEKQKKELEEVDNRPLDANQISEIIHLMMYELRNDFQYGRFKPVAREYLDIANKMRGKELNNTNNNNEIKEKSKCNIYNVYGGMHEIIGLASQKLKQKNMYDESRQMIERATLAYDYDETYNIVNEYVELVNEEEKIYEEEEEFE